MKIGFIGLGGMGKPMARNLLSAGHNLTVLNRSKGSEDELVAAGAHAGQSPATMGRDLDLVLTCLPDVPTVEAVVAGPQGLLSEPKPGLIVVDHSTIDPRTARSLAGAAQSQGAIFLDAPISGGVEGATAGTLAIMAGGDLEAYQKVQPILEAMGKLVRYLGASGAGSVAKLVNQLLMSIHSAASLEAIALGMKAGADPTVLDEIIRASYGASRMWERNAPRVMEGRFPSDAPIRLIVKDQTLIAGLSEELGLPLSVFQAARRFWSDATKNGLGEEDVAAAIRMLNR
ncbi:MAG: 3-hydroxyisobutyrate dehydrogenase/2-hydroxy-3-oxopropionate reductase [Chloroflexi bacterium]|jgi:3-hydroxyisobutyrate dehydrogenase-like beta-hydroxyacid dehydrogenase|nr:MAG: 3-hydroxyisobutyrate dehydrogenase/2-hydroxy-3-oxopropionate reductase [Chloroflexota bacterium]